MYFKWIGALIGFFVLGGRLSGAVFGFLIGMLIDSTVTKNNTNPIENRNNFIDNLLILFSFVMKADGRITKVEVNYVRSFLEKNIGREEANKKMLELRDILKDDNINLNTTCNNVNRLLTYSQRLELLHFLFEISSVDYEISQQELNTIHSIASLMKISAWDFGTIQAMYFQSRQSYGNSNNSYNYTNQPYKENTDIYYTILQVNKDASNDDIKKAYKKLVKKYHPDRVASLGEDIQKQANEKFQQINNAYEQIKKERNFN